jgi:hypothetical protein
MAARQSALLVLEKSPQHVLLAAGRLNTSWHKPFNVTQQLESIVPGDNQLRRFIPSGAELGLTNVGSSAI